MDNNYMRGNNMDNRGSRWTKRELFGAFQDDASNLSQFSHCSRYTLRPMAHRKQELTDTRSLLPGYEKERTHRKKRLENHEQENRYETRSVMNFRPPPPIRHSQSKSVCGASISNKRSALKSSRSNIIHRQYRKSNEKHHRDGTMRRDHGYHNREHNFMSGDKYREKKQAYKPIDITNISICDDMSEVSHVS